MRAMRRIAPWAALILCLLCAAPAAAAKLDRGFGHGGVVLTGFGSHLDTRAHAADQFEVEPSGAILLGVSGDRGTFTVERVGAAGALDAGFGDDGAVAVTGIQGRATAPLPDGGVVVAGSQGEGDPGRDIAVTRYTADGKLDRGFGERGVFRLDAKLEDFAEAVAVQPDGTIVVAAVSDCPERVKGCGYYGRSSLLLLRLGPRGHLLSRTSFRLETSRAYFREPEPQLGLALGPEGRILVATEALGREQPAQLIAFGADGRLQGSFGKGGAVAIPGRPYPASLTVAANGDPLLAGYKSFGRDYVQRLLPSGALDPSFGGGGTVTCKPTHTDNYSGSTWVAAAPDGGVLSSGGEGNCGLARLTAGGELDPSFGEGGLVEAFDALGKDGQPQRVAAGPGGSALVLRWQVGAGFRIARYTAAGALDPSFGKGGVATVTARAATFDQVNALLPLPGRKLLAVGGSQCGDWSCGEFALARYGPDGSLDRSFGHGGLVTTPFDGEGLATSAAIQPDGRIVVAGAVGTRAYGELHGTSPTLARYGPDGALDRGFGKAGIASIPSAEGEDVQFTGVAIAPGGDIVAVGEATCNEKQPCGKRYCRHCSAYIVARFHPGGGLDRAFGKRGVLYLNFHRTTEADNGARAVAIRPDGKIVVAGRTAIGGFGLIRLLPDGRLDPSFGHDGIVHTFFTITVHPGGGDSYDREIGRPGYALALLPGGKVLVAGGSVVPKHQGDRHPTNHGIVVRYLADGRVDPSFGHDGVVDVPGVAIRALGVDRCGRPVIAGPDTTDRQPTGFGVARLLPSGAFDPTFARRPVRLKLGSGEESRANVVAVSGDRVIAGGVASSEGAGDEFALAALTGGSSCR
jgi:uncharacterized delta-60 repeat protein